jgi:uncharacterized protein (DUF2236 family)
VLSNVVDGSRERVAAGFRRLITGDPSGAPPWAQALADGADEGYFGPQSAPWFVHSSLPTLVGGIRALLMQALHPGALAGVMQHSRYEEDALGRLAGTTQWLTVVTFGERAAADRECARVRGMHRRVSGTYEVDGEQRAYAAGDPDLLRWVHVAFTDSFLATHLAWGKPIPGGADAYVRDWAIAGELVGVTDPPRSVAELRAQLADYAPDLRGDESARRVVDFIRNVPVPLVGLPAYRTLFAGAVSTLPADYRSMLGLPPYPLAVTRPAVGAILGGLGLALGSSSPAVKASRQRLDRLAGEPLTSEAR